MSDEKLEQQDSQKKKGGKSTLLIIICLVVIIALLGTVIFLLLKKKEPAAQAPEEAGANRDLVTEDNLEDVINEMANAQTPPGNYQAIMNSTWRFEDGSSYSDNAYVENGELNSNDVYFDLKLSDTDEVIYESPVIPVGSHLDKIKLDKDLDAGTYACVLTYHLVDSQQKTLGTVNMAVTVEVRN